MTLYDYRTGDVLRRLTDTEAKLYVTMIVGDETHTGAVDGRAFGYPGRTVFATL